jgi:hypothetical protein
VKTHFNPGEDIKGDAAGEYSASKNNVNIAEGSTPAMMRNGFAGAWTALNKKGLFAPEERSHLSQAFTGADGTHSLTKEADAFGKYSFARADGSSPEAAAIRAKLPGDSFTANLFERGFVGEIGERNKVRPGAA